MTTKSLPERNLDKPYAKGKHPNSLKNLQSGYHGQDHSHNGYPLSLRLKDSLAKPLKPPPPDAPAGELIVYATLKGAVKLVPVAFRETWDRAEGKVPGDSFPQFTDNRQYNIIIQGEENKQRIEALLRGEKPKELGQGGTT